MVPVMHCTEWRTPLSCWVFTCFNAFYALIQADFLLHALTTKVEQHWGRRQCTRWFQCNNFWSFHRLMSTRRKGPRMDPWGRPKLVVTAFVNEESLTRDDHPLRYEALIVSADRDDSTIIVWWSTVPKASVNTTKAAQYK